MPVSEQLKLAVFFNPGSHVAGWRHPDAHPDMGMNFRVLAEMAQAAERAKIDMVFFPDSNSMDGSEAIRRGARYRGKYGRAVVLEPLAVLAGLAPLTSRIGLVATATSTYDEPYHVARKFASLDLISNGRAGWNLVTSEIEDDAGNFGLERHVDHATRYERAEEFIDVVTGLWDSWEGDAFVRDKSTGRYFDPGKVHFLNHRGKHFSVTGPLNVARSPQGRPVVAQAGASEAGRELAGRTADLVFTAATTLGDAKAFYADVKARARRHGRGPDEVKILPGIIPVIGETVDEARRKHDALQHLVLDEVALSRMARHSGGLDLTKYPLDGPMPDLPPSNSAKARQAMIVELARTNNMTLRQVARYYASAAGHHVVHGTAASIADLMEEWFHAGGADGFTLLFLHFPAYFDDVLNLLVPELRRRGLFRREYEGAMLRENLGLPIPSRGRAPAMARGAA